jgi:REP element-mobilizing transposase RayT
VRGNYAKLYLHLVWATWDRLPLITPELRVPVYQALNEQANRGGCEMIAVGGIQDHVHVLLKIPTTVSIAEIVVFRRWADRGRGPASEDTCSPSGSW